MNTEVYLQVFIYAKNDEIEFSSCQDMLLSVLTWKLSLLTCISKYLDWMFVMFLNEKAISQILQYEILKKLVTFIIDVTHPSGRPIYDVLKLWGQIFVWRHLETSNFFFVFRWFVAPGWFQLPTWRTWSWICKLIRNSSYTARLTKEWHLELRISWYRMTE